MLVRLLRLVAGGVAGIIVLAGCASVRWVSEVELAAESDAQFQQMRNSMPRSTDAGIRSYIACVVRDIVLVVEEPYASKDWEVEVFDEDSVNAFAMTGENIGVFVGIFKVAVNQDQLAAVLGHEVAHVTQQHALDRVNREMSTQVAVIGATSAAGAGQYGDLIQMGAQLGLSLPYGRSQEREADLIGLDYMASAGYDPREAVKLWKNMEQEKKLGPPEWLSTHPSGDTRIQELIERLPAALARYNEAKAAGKNPRCKL